jgi:hypothetical protein
VLSPASHLLWQDAGCPEITKPTHLAPGDRCAMCGHEEAMVRAKDAFGPGFTDHDKLALPGSPWVCVPCVWVLGRNPPHSFRLWAIVWREDWTAPPGNEKAAYPHGPRTLCTSKADMSAVIDTLLSPPPCRWVVSIPESGQIHTLPFARVNQGDGDWVVRYEREDVASNPAELAEVLYHVASLLDAGFVRDDVVSLEPHPSKLVKYGIAKWREHAEPLRMYRRSALIAMAIILTKRETTHAVRVRSDASRTRSGAAHDEQRQHQEHITHGLVAAGADRAPDRGAEVADVGRVHHHHGKKAGDRNTSQGVRQLDLFDGP